MKISPIIYCALLCCTAFAQEDVSVTKLIAVDKEVQNKVEELAKGKPEAIPKKYAAETKAAIKLENLTREAGGDYVATFRFINPSKNKISFYTVQGGAWKTEIQFKEQGEWVRPECHVFVSARYQELTVEPGQSVATTEKLNGAELPARIGISCWHTDSGPGKRFAIWSDPVER